jgi:hypothetical protein
MGVVGQCVNARTNRLQELIPITAWQVGTTDRIFENGIADETYFFLGVVKKDTPRAMSRHVADFEGQPECFDGIAIVDPPVDLG